MPPTPPRSATTRPDTSASAERYLAQPRRVPTLPESPEQSPPAGPENGLHIIELTAYYGSRPAVAGVNPHHRPATGHRAHRPVRLRQIHPAALPQRHAHDYPRGRGVRAGTAGAHRHPRHTDRPGRAAPSRRDGVPATQPLPHHVDLRQRSSRSDTGRPPSPLRQLRRHRRAGLDPGAAVERGQRPAQSPRRGPVRRTATTAVHRPRGRRGA